MTVAWERGFRRLTTLVSGVLLVVGLGWSALYGLYDGPGWPMFLGAVLLALLFAVMPWLIFLAVRWLARGFRDERTSAPNSPNPGSADAVEAARLLDELASSLAAGEIAPARVESILSSLPLDKLRLMQRTLAEKLTSLERRRQEVIDQGAKEGKTLSTESVIGRIMEARATYDGQNREQFIREIDEQVNALREKYGPAIPVDEAYRLSKGLEAASVVEPESGLLAYVRLLSAPEAKASYSDLQELRVREKRKLTPKECGEVVNFASLQCGLWHAQWLLSPSASPDARAEEESKGWEEVYSECRDLLVKHLPDLRHLLDRQHEIHGLGPTLNQRLHDDAGRPVRRLTSALLSRAGILASRVGMQRLGRGLYARALYPKGTVGRGGG